MAQLRPSSRQYTLPQFSYYRPTPGRYDHRDKAGRRMITLTRIKHLPLILNADLIEHIQATPDTVITLTNGHNYLVLESPDEVVRKVIAFRREIFSGLPRVTGVQPE